MILHTPHSIISPRIYEPGQMHPEEIIIRASERAERRKTASRIGSTISDGRKPIKPIVVGWDLKEMDEPTPISEFPEQEEDDTTPGLKPENKSTEKKGY